MKAVKFVVLFVVGLVLSMGSAFAAIDTSLSTPVTDISAYWTTIQAVLLTVAVFMIGLAFLNKLRRH
jgi:hypothetical protein